LNDEAQIGEALGELDADKAVGATNLGRGLVNPLQQPMSIKYGHLQPEGKGAMQKVGIDVVAVMVMSIVLTSTIRPPFSSSSFQG